MHRIPIDDLKVALEQYNSGRDVAGVLGCTDSTVSRLCKEYGLETPAQRRKRERQEAFQERKEQSRWRRTA